MNTYQVHTFPTPFRVLTYPSTKQPNMHLLLLLHANTNTTLCSSLTDDSFSIPKPTQLGYSAPGELFGLDEEFKPRVSSKANSHTPEPRSWFGPNGQYIRELPCPSCRGRGYTPCTECGIERSRSDCPICNGKSLNAKTGLFSNRMKIIHQDPMLQAQRVAAIKKAKGTVAARKQTSKAMKAYFSDPINRQKRSMAMKGVKFYCQNCGREGHRRHYCPELKDSLIDRRFACRLCGEKGHNRRTCRKLRISHSNGRVIKHHQCKICHQYGHNSRTCPQVVSNKIRDMASRRSYKCRLCHREGHNIRTCPSRTVVTEHPED
ncbi:uncharacterized protein LOC133288624 isoform X3 [Gastrolobium bilobum]|uniref:uncharacterized protein LOC133288624 isoform X3 n=1 Tax=Gastrolobium bilobum TaxID=150636 RepID=UPI002AAFA62A|nr:uncharacterized protein LOC133288624 isoform X3 [Gastrolobium bilobum]